MTEEQKREAQRNAKRRYRERNPGAAAAASRKWRASHPEYLSVRAARQFDYASKNREKERIRAAKWRLEHPDRAAKSHADYYAKNSDVVKLRNYEYRKNNPEQYKEYAREYKSLKRANGTRLPRGTVKEMLEAQKGLCIACHANLLESGYHVDHVIPVSKGGKHCAENVQLLCPTCNRQKSAKNMADFMRSKGFLL